MGYNMYNGVLTIPFHTFNWPTKNHVEEHKVLLLYQTNVINYTCYMTFEEAQA